MNDYFERSMQLHAQLRGKIGIVNKAKVESQDDLSLAYTPGVAEPCKQIAEQPALARTLTMKGNSVAVVSDGSAVLGLGNIGPLAALPVMEGKALLFKEFADIDAFPICLDTQDSAEIIQTIRNIAPVFGGINLEDIAAPRCFEVEKALQDLGIPVFHDDQHGTAIVLYAAMLNACKFVGKRMEDLRIVINGSGAAGIAIARMLKCINFDPEVAMPVAEIIVCDSKGVIHRDRSDLNYQKKSMLDFINPRNVKGSVHDALADADVFIGVSQGGILSADDIRTMAKDPIIFPMANPIPEIMPDEAYAGGAAIVGTGRSDFPNQVNNVLAFPGIFRGALDAGAKTITAKMKMHAAKALADCVEVVERDKILPASLSKEATIRVAEAVKAAYKQG